MNIDDYSFGSITINGTTYSSDVIVSRTRVQGSWWRKEGHRLQIEDLEPVLEARPNVLIIGTGCYGRMSVPEETLSFLKRRGIAAHVAKTGEAVKLYNAMRREGNTVAALHLTC